MIPHFQLGCLTNRSTLLCAAGHRCSLAFLRLNVFAGGGSGWNSRTRSGGLWFLIPIQRITTFTALAGGSGWAGRRKGIHSGFLLSAFTGCRTSRAIAGVFGRSKNNIHSAFLLSALRHLRKKIGRKPFIRSAYLLRFFFNNHPHCWSLIVIEA